MVKIKILKNLIISIFARSNSDLNPNLVSPSSPLFPLPSPPNRRLFMLASMLPLAQESFSSVLVDESNPAKDQDDGHALALSGVQLN